MKYLIYVSEQMFASVKPPDSDMVHGPAACLHEATARPHDLIVICFDHPDHRRQAAMIEATAFLKRNPHTGATPVVAVMPSWRRDIIEPLASEGVEYAARLDIRKIAVFSTKDIVGLMADDNRMENVLARLCPYLTYAPVDHAHDLITCRAYLDRLVVGRYLLNEFCQNRNYVSCGYYQQPRTVERAGSTNHSAEVRIDASYEHK